MWSPNSTHAVNERLEGFEPPLHPENKLWNAEEWRVCS
jgi:hypothetical protein